MHLPLTRDVEGARRTLADRRPAADAEWGPADRERFGTGSGGPRDWHSVFRLATVLLPAVVVFGVEYLRHEVFHDLVPEIYGNLITGAIALGTSALILIPIYRRLEAADEKLHATEIEHAVSEERERLGRELHDGISQALFFLGVKAGALERALDAAELEPARRTAVEITQALHETSSRVRDAIFDLRTAPEPGESIGVWARSYVREFGEVHNLRGEVNETGTGVALPAPQALRIMAMIREGLHNVAKHAEAQSVMARLTWGRGSLTIAVEDDGCGLPSPVPGPDRGRYGLATLREYAQANGGTLTASTRPEGGTEVVLRLPYGGGVST
ncbi:MAG TPA: histidine kinase [bacterium]|nr:histidine kinase [bacterium]